MPKWVVKAIWNGHEWLPPDEKVPPMELKDNSMDTFVEHMQRTVPDVLWLNGNIIDQYFLNSHPNIRKKDSHER